MCDRFTGSRSVAMTYAMQRLKVCKIPYIYNTKLGVSYTLSDPEHATPAPANDATIQPVSFNLMSGVAKLSDSPVNSNIYIRDEAVNWTKPDDEKQTEQGNANHAKLITEQSEPTEPVSHAMFSADVFMAQLAGQGIHPRLMPTARALANEAWCLVRPFIERSHISRSVGEIWLPIANEIGFQVSLNIPIPDFMEGTGESLYPVEHGADIVFPFDIDLSAPQISLRRMMKSSLVIRALRANHSPKAAKALLDDLLAA